MIIITIDDNILAKFILALFLLLTIPAQPVMAAENIKIISKPKWISLPGKAIDVSINNIGQAYVIAPDGTPRRWDSKKNRWKRMPGVFYRISAAIENRPWAVNRKGVIFHYNGLRWKDKGTGAIDIAADALGNVYIAMSDGEVKKWDPLSNDWLSIGGSARRIAVDEAGSPWVVTPKGRIQAYIDEQWLTVPGHGLDIVIGGNGKVVLVSHDGTLMVYDRKASHWDRLGTKDKLKVAAVTPDGGLWVITRQNNIQATSLISSGKKIKKDKKYASDIKAAEIISPLNQALPAIAPASQAKNIVAKKQIISMHQAKQAQAKAHKIDRKEALNGKKGSQGRDGFTDPALITTKGEIKFINTRKSVADIAIGKDGSVFGISMSGSLLRWSNKYKRFESFPGLLASIAVGPDGGLWGINPLGRIFRHDGIAWRQIRGVTGSDIAVGSGGDVVISDAKGRLYKFNPSSSRFDLVPGNGVLVSLAPDGVPWTIRNDGHIQRCEELPCHVFLQKAKSIDIGSDGSVFIVSDKNVLMRFKSDKDGFERILIPGHKASRVSVGPKGLPWVVNTEKIALASSYFERDESEDRTAALSTRGDTRGTGKISTIVNSSVSGFRFSKNMRFEKVSFSSLAPGNTAIIVTGIDDSVWIYNTGAHLEKYNDRKRKFVRITTELINQGNTLSDFDIASNGDIWASTINPFNTLYRERKSNIKEYKISTSASPASVSIDAADTIYVTATENAVTRVYKKEKSENKFTRISNEFISKVAAGPVGVLWGIDNNNNVLRWTGKRFQSPPKAKPQRAFDIGSNANGDIYIIDTNNALRKWNGVNNSFDKIINTNFTAVDVDESGRPWVSVDNTPLIKRVR